MSVFPGYIFALLAHLLIFSKAEDPLVNTKYGDILGSRGISRNNRSYLSFRGIPYAKPPIGDLRFKATTPPSAWNSTLNATVDGPICMQVNKFGENKDEVIGQEDCLYLNIYVPERNNSDEPLPVMIFIHGGSFTIGSGSSLLYGPEYFMDKDVILVTINYRLGALGLLSTADDAAPGNNAFKDQVLALKFVNEVIGNFGGDKKKITLFGESAGSGSVGAHMVSPLSKGLFQQAICESGLVLTIFNKSQNEQHLEQTRSLAISVGCITLFGGNKKLIDCLRKKDASAIVKAQKITVNVILETKTESNPEPFLEKSPKDYIESGEFQKIPWIVGVNQDEGILFGASILRQKPILLLFNLLFEYNMIKGLSLEPSIIDELKLHQLYKNITNFYLGGANSIDTNNPNSVQGFLNVLSDRGFMYVTYQTVILEYLNGNENIWVYNFDYRGNGSYTDLYAGTKDDINFNWGVAHADEIPYFFESDDPAWGRKLSGTEVQVSQDLVTLWTNFAIFGDPDPNQSYNWKQVTFGDSNADVVDENLNFLNITGKFGEPPKYNAQKGFYLERMEFWEQQQIKENL